MKLLYPPPFKHRLKKENALFFHMVLSSRSACGEPKDSETYQLWIRGPPEDGWNVLQIGGDLRKLESGTGKRFNVTYARQLLSSAKSS